MNMSANKYSKRQPKAGKYLSKKNTVSNYVPAEGTVLQNKRAANAPTLFKTNQHEENCYRVDGKSRITTENIAADSILCANLC